MGTLQAPIIGVPGAGMNTAPQSSRLLINSIDNIYNRRKERREDALKALDTNEQLWSQAASKNILKDTNTGRLDPQQQLSNRVNETYNKLYDPITGKRRTDVAGYTPNQLLAKQQAWEAGGTTDDLKDKDIANLTSGKYVKSAKDYADAVYKNALDRGIDMDVAEKLRVDTFNKYKTPGLTKEQIEQRKNEYDAQKEILKARQDAWKNANTRSTSSMVSRNGGGRSGGGSYGGSRSGKGGTTVNAEQIAKNISNFADIEPDTWYFKDASDMVPTYNALRELGLNDRQTLLAMDKFMDDKTKSLGSRTYAGSKKDLNDSIIQYVKDKNLIPNAYNNTGYGSGGGSGGGYGSSSSSFNGIIDPKAYTEGSNRIIDEYKNSLRGIDNKYRTPSKYEQINDIVDRVGYGKKPILENKSNKNTVSKNAKTNNNRRNILFDKSTGKIGDAMNSRTKGQLANYALRNPKEYSKEYDNLSNAQKRRVDRVLANKSSTNVFDDYSQILQNKAKSDVLNEVKNKNTISNSEFDRSLNNKDSNISEAGRDALKLDSAVNKAISKFPDAAAYITNAFRNGSLLDYFKTKKEKGNYEPITAEDIEKKAREFMGSSEQPKVNQQSNKQENILSPQTRMNNILKNNQNEVALDRQRGGLGEGQLLNVPPSVRKDVTRTLDNMIRNNTNKTKDQIIVELLRKYPSLGFETAKALVEGNNSAKGNLIQDSKYRPFNIL